jgi:hypothetical protein
MRIAQTRFWMAGMRRSEASIAMPPESVLQVLYPESHIAILNALARKLEVQVR